MTRWYRKCWTSSSKPSGRTTSRHASLMASCATAGHPARRVAGVSAPRSSFTRHWPHWQRKAKAAKPATEHPCILLDHGGLDSVDRRPTHHGISMKQRKVTLFVITAPSGVGKTSLVRALLDIFDGIKVS